MAMRMQMFYQISYINYIISRGWWLQVERSMEKSMKINISDFFVATPKKIEKLIIPVLVGFDCSILLEVTIWFLTYPWKIAPL